MTINRANFVGLTPMEVIQRVRAMRSWHIVPSCTINERRITDADYNNLFLRPGDKLELVDP